VTPLPLFKVESRLPKTVGTLRYHETTIFEDPKMGVQFRYASPEGVKADIYLYNFGLKDIPDDITSPRVTEFFQAACNDVRAVAQRGILLDLEVKASQYLHLPENAPLPLYLWAAFYYRQAPGPFTDYEGMRYSHLALRTDNGYINKVRYTYPDTLAESAAEDLLFFLADWYNAVQDA
jgi:hypothetical protein